MDNRADVPQNQAAEAFTIDLTALLRALGRAWKLLIAAAVVGALVGAAYCGFFARTTFKATSRLYLQDSLDIQDAKDADGTVITTGVTRTGVTQVEDLKVMATSGVVLQNVIDQLGLEMSTSALRNCVKASSKSTSNFVTIVVTTPNAAQSTEIANAVMSAGADAFNAVNGSGRLQAVAYFGARGASRNKPSMKRFAGLGGLACLLLACVCVLLRALFDTRLRDESDVERSVGLPVLAVIHTDRK